MPSAILCCFEWKRNHRFILSFFRLNLSKVFHLIFMLSLQFSFLREHCYVSVISLRPQKDRRHFSWFGCHWQCDFSLPTALFVTTFFLFLLFPFTISANPLKWDVFLKRNSNIRDEFFSFIYVKQTRDTFFSRRRTAPSERAKNLECRT